LPDIEVVKTGGTAIGGGLIVWLANQIWGSKEAQLKQHGTDIADLQKQSKDIEVQLSTKAINDDISKLCAAINALADSTTKALGAKADWEKVVTLREHAICTANTADFRKRLESQYDALDDKLDKLIAHSTQRRETDNAR
jgi:hypothetical protein